MVLIVWPNRLKEMHSLIGLLPARCGSAILDLLEF